MGNGGGVMFRKCLDINSQALFELLLFDLQCSLIE